MTLIDTNVLIDLATDDASWADWSQSQLERAALEGPLVINEIVYAELSVGFARIEDLDAFLVDAGIDLIYLPTAAARHSGNTETPEARGPASLPISLSARMPRSVSVRC